MTPPDRTGVAARAASALWRRFPPDRLLLAGALLALVACLFKPGLSMERDRFEHLVVLDVTQSMNVADQTLDGRSVSRLVLARQAVRQALLSLPCGSKVGLALFTEYRSFLLVAPLEVCEHLGELRGTLDRIDTRMAWTGNSEVAKGLYGGLTIAGQLPGKPSLVFITDGHESPPVNARHRPAFNGERGAIAGWVAGVGGLVPQPIPKSDPQGRPIGIWQADEVLQVDPRSLGRGGSLGSEAMVEETGAAPVPALPGATPGREHLSALRDAYLRLLADETGLGYAHVVEPGALGSLMTAPSLARPVAARADLRPALGAVALLLLLARHLPWLALRQRWSALSPARAPAASR